MTSIDQAVIPAAGKGTRLARIGGGAPKEMLAVGGIPLADRAVREAFRGGVKRVILVVSPEKRAFGERYRDPVLLESLGGSAGDRSVEIALQERPTGLADAVGAARTRMDGGPFALLLPDNVYDGDSIGEMLPAFRSAGISAAGLIAVPPERWKGFGNCGVVEREPGDGPRRIVRIGPKKEGVFRGPDPERPALRWFGRSILTNAFFEEMDRTVFPPGGERDDVPVMQRLVAGEGILGVPLARPGFDAGNETGLALGRAYFEKEEGR